MNSRGRIVRRGRTQEFGIQLSELVAMWPTARSEDSESSGRRHTWDVSDTLTAGSRDLRTPNGTDWKGESAHSWQTRTDGDPTPRLADQVATLGCLTGPPVPPTTPPGLGCSNAGPTSPPQWQTPTQLDGAGRDYTYPSGDHDAPFLTLTRQARGGMRQGPTRRLNPRFVEWLMGVPIDWTAEVPRVDRLRCLGNAVVPMQAAYAIALLVQELEAYERQTLETPRA